MAEWPALPPCGLCGGIMANVTRPGEPTSVYLCHYCGNRTRSLTASLTDEAAFLADSLGKLHEKDEQMNKETDSYTSQASAVYDEFSDDDDVDHFDHPMRLSEEIVRLRGLLRVSSESDQLVFSRHEIARMKFQAALDMAKACDGTPCAEKLSSWLNTLAENVGLVAENDD